MTLVLGSMSKVELQPSRTSVHMGPGGETIEMLACIWGILTTHDLLF
jgi:hypothetical protein